MQFQENILINKSKNLFIFATLFSIYFLWDINNLNLFYIIIIPIILHIFKDIKILIKKKHLILLFIFFLIFIHHLITNSFNLNLSYLIKISYLYLIFLFCLFFYENFEKNLKILVYSFCFFYYFLLILNSIVNLDIVIQSFENIFIYKNELFNIKGNFWNFCQSSIPFFLRSKIIFQENSHLGMINVAVCLLLIYYASFEKNKLVKSLILLFPLISITNSSTTFFVGFIICTIIILILGFKKLPNLFINVSIFLSIIIILINIFDETCNHRYSQLTETNNSMIELVKQNNRLLENTKINENINTFNENIITFNDLIVKRIKLYNELDNELYNYSTGNVKNNTNRNKIENIKKQILNIEKKLNEINKEKFEYIKKGYSYNLTNQVHIRSYYLALHSLKNKFLGWGFDNYHIAFDEYKFEVPAFNPVVLSLNTRDASNNLSKIVTEFGIFSIFFFLFLTIISFEKKVPIHIKIFLISIIITQLIRGAGYFNGGFILSVTMYIFTYFKYRNLNKT